MFGSRGGRCGIASYTADLIAALRQCESDLEVDLVEAPYLDRDPAAFRERLRLLNAADVVHIQHEYTFFGGIKPGASSLPGYLQRIERPIVMTPHTVFSARELLRVDQETRPRQRLAKELLSRIPRYRRTVELVPFAAAGALIVPTRKARECLAGRGIPAGRIHVIPWGMPPAPAPDPDRVTAWKERLKPPGARLATIFGYVNPDKGYELALEALRPLPPQLRLAIAGGTRVEHERGYLAGLCRRIIELGLAERVKVTDYLEPEDVAAVMSVSDLVLLPHTAANGSYSLMLALGAGKAVLASDLACFGETAEEAGCPELFPTGDARALSDRLGFLTASAAARRRLEQAALGLRAARDWSVVAAQTAAVYRQVLDPGRSEQGTPAHLGEAGQGGARE